MIEANGEAALEIKAAAAVCLSMFNYDRLCQYAVNLWFFFICGFVAWA